MSSAIPGLVSFSRPARRVTVSNYPHEPAADVVIQSDQVDAGNTAFRTTFLRPGCVLAKRTSTGEYVLASDTNADHQAAASVATIATNPGSGGWNGNLIILGHWGTLTVALSADDTDAAVAAAIIAAAAAVNPEQGPITAADTTGEVTITNKDKGAGTWLKAYHATVSDVFNTGAGVVDGAQGAIGTDPEIVVTTDYVDMLNGAGTAVDAASGPVLRAGHFDAANLIQPTAEAIAVLLKNGSRLYGTLTLVG
jgi:hypothetical protein